jgi:hypothetical protein
VPNVASEMRYEDWDKDDVVTSKYYTEVEEWVAL